MGLNDAMNKFQSGDAFKNPYSAQTGGISSAVSGITGLTIPSSLPGVDSTTMSDLLAQFTDAKSNAASSLQGMSAQLTNQATALQNNLGTDLAINNSVQGIKTQITEQAPVLDAGTSCGPDMKDAFKTLSPETYELLDNTIGDAAAAVGEIAGGALDSVAAINNAIARLNGVKSNVDSKISQFGTYINDENVAKAKALQYVKDYALVSILQGNLSDPCIAYVGGLMTDVMGDII